MKYRKKPTRRYIMNKRMKKKRKLIEQVQGTKEAVDIALDLIKSLIYENTEQAQEIAELRSIIERNAQATNSRFNYLEKKVADKVSKKSWFSRK